MSILLQEGFSSQKIALDSPGNLQKEKHVLMCWLGNLPAGSGVNNCGCPPELPRIRLNHTYTSRQHMVVCCGWIFIHHVIMKQLCLKWFVVLKSRTERLMSLEAGTQTQLHPLFCEFFPFFALYWRHFGTSFQHSSNPVCATCYRSPEARSRVLWPPCDRSEYLYLCPICAQIVLLFINHWAKAIAQAGRSETSPATVSNISYLFV